MEICFKAYHIQILDWFWNSSSAYQSNLSLPTSRLRRLRFCLFLIFANCDLVCLRWRNHEEQFIHFDYLWWTPGWWFPDPWTCCSCCRWTQLQIYHFLIQINLLQRQNCNQRIKFFYAAHRDRRSGGLDFQDPRWPRTLKHWYLWSYDLFHQLISNSAKWFHQLN